MDCDFRGGQFRKNAARDRHWRLAGPSFAQDSILNRRVGVIEISSAPTWQQDSRRAKFVKRESKDFVPERILTSEKVPIWNRHFRRCRLGQIMQINQCIRNSFDYNRKLLANSTLQVDEHREKQLDRGTNPNTSVSRSR